MTSLRLLRLGGRRMKYVWNAVALVVLFLFVTSAFSVHSGVDTEIITNGGAADTPLSRWFPPAPFNSDTERENAERDATAGNKDTADPLLNQKLEGAKALEEAAAAGSAAEGSAADVSGTNLESQQSTAKPAEPVKPAVEKEEVEPEIPLEMGVVSGNDYNDPTGQRMKLAHAFYSKVFQLYRDGEPKCPPVTRLGSDGAKTQGVEDDAGPAFTKEYLSSFIELTPAQKEELTKSHKMMVDELPDSYPEGLYKGTGIVYVGGGVFNWYSLLSIVHLRKLGCTLPVEVVIPSLEEYEENLCSSVFPAYGAHCIFLPKVLNEEVRHDFLFKGYQYKGLALLVSSFEEVLLLDADNIPAVTPQPAFEEEPYKSTGLVVWPDFWKRTTHPDFYEIAGIEIGEERLTKGYSTYGKKQKKASPGGVPILHQMQGAIPDPSSESGQLMWSKKNHTKDMFMSLYYNMYGPNFYYPLFSQGAAGEGDKETFITGAHVLGKPYYQVRKLVNSIGHFRNGKYRGVAMKQVDPMEDYNLVQKYKDSNEKVSEEPRLMFLHVNFPKFEPIKLKEKGFVFNAKTGERNRFLGDFNEKVGYDFELEQYKSMKSFVCDLGIEFEYFRSKMIPRDEICDEVDAQIEFLQKTPS